MWDTHNKTNINLTKTKTIQKSPSIYKNDLEIKINFILTTWSAYTKSKKKKNQLKYSYFFCSFYWKQSNYFFCCCFLRSSN